MSRRTHKMRWCVGMRRSLGVVRALVCGCDMGLRRGFGLGHGISMELDLVGAGMSIWAGGRCGECGVGLVGGELEHVDVVWVSCRVGWA